MAAISGFELSASSTDLIVADGMFNGEAVEGATLDLASDLAASGTAKVLVTIDDSNTIAFTKGDDHADTPVLPDAAEGEVGLGSGVVNTTAVASTSYEGRGSVEPASA